jgi:DNA-binding response OmpR family regulator
LTERKLVLVADEAVIGRMLEDELRAAGYEVAGPFATCASAIEWLESGTPDLAVLEYILRDSRCTKLARVLRQRGVPFVIYSGSRRGVTRAPEFKGVPWIEKPAPFARLEEALAKLARARPGPSPGEG